MIIIFNFCYLLLLSLFFLGYKYSRSVEIKGVFTFLFLVVIFFVYSMRGIDSGVDYSAYIDVYTKSLILGEIDEYLLSNEIGYQFINYIGAIVLQLEHEVFFGFVGVLIWIFLCFRFDRVNIYFVVLSITAGYLYSSFNTIRQAIALSIFIYSLFYLIDNKKVRYYSSNIVAFFFHKSAIITFMFPLLTRVYYNKNILLILYFFSLPFVFFPLSGEVFRTVALYVSKWMSFIDYSYILEYGEFQTESERLSSGLGVMYNIACNIFIIWQSNKSIEKNDNSKIVFLLFFSGCFFQNIFFAIESVNRILMYFVYLKPLAFSLIIDSEPSKLTKCIVTLLSLGYIVLFLYSPPVTSLR
ncbi:EpsG family protein [Vibrio alginolyticus]|uniref:EpsG family protein n=1 Tax=Vibrio alginolyticus TaxID=663 RepID=UPI000802D854|nr:EpsG family protein [Vibrio alginolyticus]ANP63458.1 hypothetical protein BAU10_00045 [Vibrio alginolyticus]